MLFFYHRHRVTLASTLLRLIDVQYGNKKSLSQTNFQTLPSDSMCTSNIYSLLNCTIRRVVCDSAHIFPTYNPHVAIFTPSSPPIFDDPIGWGVPYNQHCVVQFRTITICAVVDAGPEEHKLHVVVLMEHARLR